MSWSSIVSLIAVVLFALLGASSAQTNLVVNGDFEQSGFSGWSTPLGIFDPFLNRSSLFVSGPSRTAGPGPTSYSGYYELCFLGTSLNQSVVQNMSVQAGQQYTLSFFLFFMDVDETSYFQATYQHDTDSAPTVVATKANFPSPPFWWTQYKTTWTAPSSASSVTLAFVGSDMDYGFCLDYVTLYNGDSNTAPGPAPSIKPNPYNNLLINGDFEAGTVYPWQQPNGDNPYSNYTQMGTDGAYEFVAPTGSGIWCPQGLYCLTFGAPYVGLPITQTLSVSSGANYTLSFIYNTPGGYSSTEAAGSLFSCSYYWGSDSSNSTFIINQVNQTAAIGNTTVVANLGMPPSGSSTLTLTFNGYSWPSWYTIDYVILTTGGGPTGAAAIGAQSSYGLVLAAATAVVTMLGMLLA